MTASASTSMCPSTGSSGPEILWAASTGAAVAPDVGGDLATRQGRQLRVEAAEAHDLHVPVRVPALLAGEHAREDPGGGAEARDADRLALEIADPLDVRRHVEGEVIALGVGRDHLDRR